MSITSFAALTLAAALSTGKPALVPISALTRIEASPVASAPELPVSPVLIEPALAKSPQRSVELPPLDTAPARGENDGLPKVLLATGGVVEGIGAFRVTGSLLFIETRVAAADAGVEELARAPSVRFAPFRFTGGYGLKATAQF